MADQNRNGKKLIDRLKKLLSKDLHDKNTKSPNSDVTVTNETITSSNEDPIIAARIRAQEILNNLEIIANELKSDSMNKANGYSGLNSNKILRKGLDIQDMIAELRSLSATYRDGEIQEIFKKSLDSKYTEYAESRYLQTILKERSEAVRKNNFGAPSSSKSNIPVSTNYNRNNDKRKNYDIDPVKTE